MNNGDAFAPLTPFLRCLCTGYENKLRKEKLTKHSQQISQLDSTLLLNALIYEKSSCCYRHTHRHSHTFSWDSWPNENTVHLYFYFHTFSKVRCCVFFPFDRAMPGLSSISSLCTNISLTCSQWTCLCTRPTQIKHIFISSNMTLG